LLRDGTSLLVLQRYQKDGLVVPDRFDIDRQKPGTKGVQLLEIKENTTLRELV